MKLKKIVSYIILLLVPAIMFVALRSATKPSIQRSKNNALMLAAQTRKPEQVRKLIAEGADVNISANFDRETPLHKVAANCGASNSVKTALVLLRNGANVNAKNINGQTALLTASSRGGVKMVILLLSHNANVNIKDVHGYTALKAADASAQSEYSDKNTQLKIVAILKKAGAK